MLEKIWIYHTNDIHSHFDYWPRIHQFLVSEKRKRAGQMFLFDIGDHVDRFHPFTEGTLGKGNVELLNKAGYQAVTIGNNEGITLSHQDLAELYENAQFDCILANLYEEDGTRPFWAIPWKMFETPYGTKLGVIGVTVNFSNYYNPLQWKVTDPIEELARWLPKIRQEADIVVVLSHLGLSDDERIANLFPEVDIILGAHTHHILENGSTINNCLLCCTGKYGQNVGKVELVYDQEKNAIVSKKATLIPSEKLPEAPSEKEELLSLFERGKSLLNNPVAFLPKNLSANSFEESELSQLLCSALTEWCSADCAFMNAGILIEGLDQGIVTEFDIHRICPHPINPIVVPLNGQKLKEVLVETMNDQYMTLEVKGFGFRGKVFGKIIYDNIQFAGKGAAMKIRIGGKDLEPDHIYRVATIDMFAFARFYPVITRSEKQFYLPEFLRDLLSWKLAELFPVPKNVQ